MVLIDSVSDYTAIFGTRSRYSDALPKNLQVLLSDVRTLIKLNYRNQWLEELSMTRKQNSTELSRTMLTQEVPEA